MNKQSSNNLESEVEQKYKKRDRKKKSTMKVSGASVRSLQKIIKNK